METTQHTPADVPERVDVPGLPDGITPLTGVFTTHHAGRPHAIVLWQGAPWLVWQHPDGNWVTEAKVQVAALLRTPRGEWEASGLAECIITCMGCGQDFDANDDAQARYHEAACEVVDHEPARVEIARRLRGAARRGVH